LNIDVHFISILAAIKVWVYRVW